MVLEDSSAVKTENQTLSVDQQATGTDDDQEANPADAKHEPIPTPSTAAATGPHSMVLTSKSVQDVLFKTLTDLQIRTEVESCLGAVLLDVELTYEVQLRLQVIALEQQVHQLVKEQNALVLESQAERTLREEERLEMADQLVREIITVNQQMTDLMEWKHQNQHKVGEYDALQEQLDVTQEALEKLQRDGVVVAKSLPNGQPDDPLPQNTSSTPTPVSIVESISVEQPAATVPDPVSLPQASTKSDETDASLSKTVPQSTSGEQSDTETKTPPPQKGEGQQTNDTATKEEEPAAAVVSLDLEASKEESVPGLVELEMEILMVVFGFLDAMDILNTAQISAQMYTKVDNIFGISEDGQSPPQPAASAVAAPSQQQTSSQPSQPGPSQPSQLSTPQDKGLTTGSVGAQTPSSNAGLGAGLFSMLQPNPGIGVARLSPAAKSASSVSPSKGPLLNASVAQSMAAKLSDSELAAIISMTDKLSKMEKEVTMLRTDKQELSAKLDGTEAVKQFLIGKVRDVETRLTQSRDDEIKVAHQISSDQEVIAFLDSRVQELERAETSQTNENKTTKVELESLKVSSSKKVTMLSDMLKYEREKLEDEESEWKATKKVLVKEVKSCRAQLVALQAERDGFKEQNEMLKRAITSSGKTPPQNAMR